MSGLPDGFIFGTSTAAPQIEGATTVDGRGRSIWDDFAQVPGVILDATTPETTCDSFRRGSEDLDLLRQLGTDSYRFSIAWPRIQPEGTGPANQAGLDHYDRFVDQLLEAGQQPMATLYHWDLPAALEADGGWLNPGTADHFADYAALVAERLADRVAHWVPVNEPNVHSLLGYGDGSHAPGKPLTFDALWAYHHLLVAHGHGVGALRSAGATSVGCANNHAPIWPASESDEDLGASKLFDAIYNGSLIEPMLLGRYPADLAPLMEPMVRPGDLATIRQPLDFYGVNYYNPMKVAAAPPESDMPFVFRDIVGHEVTGHGWPVVPEAFRELLITLRARYRAALPPLMITETGCSYPDPIGTDGRVDDQARIAFLASHLEAVAAAMAAGVDVRGYFVWSLMDNWEWDEGFSQRFGLVHVDFDTLARTPKASFDWYRSVIAEHRARA